jgi:hypothetical protein
VLPDLNLKSTLMKATCAKLIGCSMALLVLMMIMSVMKRAEESPKNMLPLNGSFAAGVIAIFQTAGSNSQVHVNKGMMCKAHRLLNDIVDVDMHDDRGADDDVIDGDRANETPKDSLTAGSIAVFTLQHRNLKSTLTKVTCATHTGCCMTLLMVMFTFIMLMTMSVMKYMVTE